jgi:hypothetical protein
MALSAKWKGMTQPQREALFDILALAIHADAHVSLAEADLAGLAFVKRGWKSAEPKGQFIEASLERALEIADSDDAMMDYLAERADVFSSASAQKEACAVLKSILEADGMPVEDNEFYHLFVQALPRAG